MTDPWLIQNTSNYNEIEVTVVKELEQVENQTAQTPLGFEDNFTPSAATAKSQIPKLPRDIQPLPDSAAYLQGLERKLLKIKKGSKLVEALAEKRQDCLRTLLQQEDGIGADSVINNNAILELDAPLSNGESTVQEIYRQLQPVQPMTVGEIVHIVKYDQLEEQREVQGSVEEEPTASR